MKILQRKQLQNQIEDLKQSDIAISGAAGGSAGIDADGNVPSEPVVNVDSRWDNSTVDIPAIMKIFPPKFADNKKRRRHDIYEAQSIFEQMYIAPGQFNFKEVFENEATEKRLNIISKWFYSKTEKSNTVLIVFPKQPNLEIELTLEHNVNSSDYKLKLSIKLMPWSQFKYCPIDNKTLIAKVNSESECIELIANAVDNLEERREEFYKI